jgi:hypothetical protein
MSAAARMRPFLEAGAAAHGLAADALHALERTASILDARSDTLPPAPTTAQRH